MPIEAGKALQVRVSCPERTPWSRWVMAVPGQEVEAAALTRDTVSP
jgi:eukaryotic-like serine/threonine-protein kinase